MIDHVTQLLEIRKTKNGIFNSKYLQWATLEVDKHMITGTAYHSTMWAKTNLASAKDA